MGGQVKFGIIVVSALAVGLAAIGGYHAWTNRSISVGDAPPESPSLALNERDPNLNKNPPESKNSGPANPLRPDVTNENTGNLPVGHKDISDSQEGGREDGQEDRTQDEYERANFYAREPADEEKDPSPIANEPLKLKDVPFGDRFASHEEMRTTPGSPEASTSIDDSSSDANLHSRNWGTDDFETTDLAGSETKVTTENHLGHADSSSNVSDDTDNDDSTSTQGWWSGTRLAGENNYQGGTSDRRMDGTSEPTYGGTFVQPNNDPSETSTDESTNDVAAENFADVAPQDAIDDAHPTVESPELDNRQPVAKTSNYVVAPRDTLWSISKSAYGSGSYYKALFSYRRDRSDNQGILRPGESVELPSVEVLRLRYPNLCPID